MQPDPLRGQVSPIVSLICAYGISESGRLTICHLRARWQLQYLVTREHQADGRPIPAFNDVGEIRTRAQQSPHLREGSCPSPQVGPAQWIRVRNRLLEHSLVAQYESGLSNRSPVKVGCLRICRSSQSFEVCG